MCLDRRPRFPNYQWAWHLALGPPESPCNNVRYRYADVNGNTHIEGLTSSRSFLVLITLVGFDAMGCIQVKIERNLNWKNDWLSKSWMYFPLPTSLECCCISSSPASLASGEPCNSDYAWTWVNANQDNHTSKTDYLNRDQSFDRWGCHTRRNRTTSSRDEHKMQVSKEGE